MLKNRLFRPAAPGLAATETGATMTKAPRASMQTRAVRKSNPLLNLLLVDVQVLVEQL